MKRVVFDAFAVIAWLQGEPGEAYVSSLLYQISDRELWGGICAVNIGEVYYNILRKRGEDTAETYLRFLQGLDWEIIPASNELVWAAARLKARFAISYADAFALACAQQHQADLVTDDHELRTAKHGVAVLWATA